MMCILIYALCFIGSGFGYTIVYYSLPILSRIFGGSGERSIIFCIVWGQVTYGIFGRCDVAEACIMEHALETQVFIDVRPMDAAIGELESLPLGGGGAA